MCVVREGVGDQGKGGIWEGMGKAEPSSWQLPRQGAEKCRRSFQWGRWIAVLRAGHRGDVPLFDTSPISECPKQLSITQQVKVSQWALLNLTNVLVHRWRWGWLLFHGVAGGLG